MCVPEVNDIQVVVKFFCPQVVETMDYLQLLNCNSDYDFYTFNASCEGHVPLTCLHLPFILPLLCCTVAAGLQGSFANHCSQNVFIRFIVRLSLQYAHIICMFVPIIVCVTIVKKHLFYTL